MTSNDWNPKDYLAFKVERARPARDLIARIPSANPHLICDLGCGPGNSTALLKEAYPDAQILGFDSSPAMIAEARKAVPGAMFDQANAENWTPPAKADLVFSNALFQWISGHGAVMRRILEALSAGAVLAVQMPDNLAEPSHRLMGEVAREGPWREKLAQASRARSALLAPPAYHDLLAPLSSRIDIWRTTYHHLLPGHDAIADMLATTGLRPYLDPLNEDEKQSFRANYVLQLTANYPVTAGGKVLFPFPRLFLMAVRK